MTKATFVYIGIFAMFIYISIEGWPAALFSLKHFGYS